MQAARSGPASVLAAPGTAPNLRLGLRTTLASVLPLLGVLLLHEPALIWMALGGLYVNMADTGGAYRTRATAMASATLLGTLALAVGIGIGVWPWLCVAAMFAVAVACGLLSLYGNSGALIGLVTAWCFLIGINVANPDPAKALTWSLLYLAGGIWATVLAVALWPLRPYRPVRQALSEAHRAIAHYLTLACPDADGMPAPEEQLYREKLRVRDALARARATLADTRSGRLGDSPADGVYTELIETADGLFVTAAALGDLLAAVPQGASPQTRRRMGRLSGRCAATLLDLDQALLGRSPLPALDDLDSEARQIAGEIEGLRASDTRGAMGVAALERAQARLAHWITTLGRAAKAIPAAAHTRRSPQSPHHPITRARASLAQGWATLRANLTLRSMVFRHALRFGTASALAVATYTLFALPIGYWITLTVSVILRPSAGETLARTQQRLLGTVLGGILAIVLASLFPHPVTIVVLMVPLTVVMMAVLPVNYGLFVFFLTPWIVLYKDIDQPGDWNLALWRIGNTLIGAALSLVAIHGILPRWERQDLPDRLAASLRSQARFAGTVLDVYLGSLAAAPGAIATPTELRLAMSNAHGSIQRFLSETPSHRPMAVPLMAFLLHSQRLIDALVVLASCQGELEGGPASARFRTLRDGVLGALETLATALERNEVPTALPDLRSEQRHLEEADEFPPAPAGGPDPTPNPAARLLLERLGPLVEAIAGLQGAVGAWCAQDPGPESGLPSAAPWAQPGSAD